MTYPWLFYPGCFTVGVLSSLLHLTLLSRSIKRLTRRGTSMRAVVGGFLTRVIIMGIFFGALIPFGTAALLIALAGFLVTRTVSLRVICHRNFPDHPLTLTHREGGAAPWI